MSGCVDFSKKMSLPIMDLYSLDWSNALSSLSGCRILMESAVVLTLFLMLEMKIFQDGVNEMRLSQ